MFDNSVMIFVLGKVETCGKVFRLVLLSGDVFEVLILERIYKFIVGKVSNADTKSSDLIKTVLVTSINMVCFLLNKAQLFNTF